MSSPLSYPERGALLLISVAAIGVHVVFNRREPRNPLVHAALLGLPPMLLSTLFWNTSGPIYAVYMSFVAFFAVLCTSIVLYRISPFHPLARYPGPLLNKITKLYFSSIVMQGQSHLYVHKLHQQYGDVVRLGPNEVSICNASVIQDMFGTGGLPRSEDVDPSPKSLSSAYMGRTMWSGNPPMLAMSGEAHLARRKWWNRAFNSTALKGYETIISRRAEQLSGMLDKAAGEKVEIDLGLCFSYFMWDFMNDMAFGGGSDMLTQGEEGSMWHVLAAGLASGQFFANLPWLALYASKLPAFGQDIKRLRMYGIQRAKERVQRGSVQHDLFYYLNNEDGVQKEARPLAHVISDGALAVIAGSDTTANVITHVFYYLLCNPTEYMRLQAEVDKFYPPGENSLDTEYHSDMPFMNAVINEALRLLPVLANGSDRTTPALGRLVGSIFLPGGTNATVHVYSVHRDPRNFAPNATSFWPARWLIATGEMTIAEAGISQEEFVHNSSAFIPFSLGPANCVGKNLALQEMRTLICLIMQRFFLRFAAGYNPASYEDNVRNFFIMQKPELLLTVERRG
ncbi:hypothetical protein CERSUDRAFT_77592 [Gelatoporia subvermispora B]|uniref:High nitrogen upregulated cytochrome P450 monooxygenase 2 n=1 Tax=Ceriporiopsis subvermispora (strain B) TaxID=914234 RepID=M2P9Z3_CERS8|nr:hypothetical protein CERSUDRAFT_77592 [Gelatoporia subvermispora B]